MWGVNCAAKYSIGHDKVMYNMFLLLLLSKEQALFKYI